MPAPQYALVTYLKNELGRFVEELRRELHPELGHLPVHMSILPPRPLRGSEAQALATLGRLCESVAPFAVTVDGMESFLPVTPTVYLRVETPSLMNALHDRLNTEALACTEQWPYVSHLTIVKLADESRVPGVLELARERWRAYRGSRQAWVEELTFVREAPTASHWMDLAPVPLGRALASRPRD
jgi:2'-5' RNA ligase